METDDTGNTDKSLESFQKEAKDERESTDYVEDVIINTSSDKEAA